MPQQPGTGGDCIFCQLLDNPQQTLTVHETNNFRAWLDINPRAKGHTMIIPKDHTESAEALHTIHRLVSVFHPLAQFWTLSI